MKKGYFILIILLTGICIFSCKKKKEPIKPDLGEDYYPTTIGKYVIYDVDSIIYDEFTYKATVYKYQIKEKITEEYTDIQGRPALKLMRYIKKFDSIIPYSAMAWTIKDAWQVNVTNKDVQVVDENVRLTKLTFPVKENNTWDGNVYNTYGKQDYKYVYVNSNESVNNVHFDNVASVLEKDFPTFISKAYYVEKYAKTVGLVYRQIIDLNYDTVVTNINYPYNSIRKKKGVVYTSKVIAYGNE